MSTQLTLPIHANDNACFENFYSGSNASTVEALKSLVETGESQPVLLRGHTGSGKSHLLFAVARRLKALDKTFSYLDLSQEDAVPALLEYADADAWVLLDDLHAWAGELEKERALFALYERVKRADGVWLGTANASVEAIGFQLPDLVSRLRSGLDFHLQTLDEAGKLEALRLRALHRGISLREDAIQYLANRFSRDMHQLFELLEKIDRDSLQAQRKVTIPFLRELLNKT